MTNTGLLGAGVLVTSALLLWVDSWDGSHGFISQPLAPGGQGSPHLLPPPNPKNPAPELMNEEAPVGG